MGFLKWFSAGIVAGFLQFSACSFTKTIINAEHESYPIKISMAVDGLKKNYSFEYKNFGRIDFSRLPDHKVALPDVLSKIVDPAHSISKAIDIDRLEDIILSKARELGHSEKSMASLDPKSAVILAADIVSSILEYHDVDNDPVFINEHGEHRPIEVYLALGKGDCDKYSSAMNYVLDFIKKKNSSLDNVYVTEELGGFNNTHLWNSLILQLEDSIILSHIDLTYYDSGESFEAIPGFHISSDPLEIAGRFLYDTKQYAESIRILTKVKDDSWSRNKKSGILHMFSMIALSTQDYELARDSVQEYFSLCNMETSGCRYGERILSLMRSTYSFKGISHVKFLDDLSSIAYNTSNVHIMQNVLAEYSKICPAENDNKCIIRHELVLRACKVANKYTRKSLSDTRCVELDAETPDFKWFEKLIEE